VKRPASALDALIAVFRVGGGSLSTDELGCKGPSGIGFATQANTNVKALKAANDYCEKLGKHLLFQRNAESGVYG